MRAPTNSDIQRALGDLRHYGGTDEDRDHVARLITNLERALGLDKKTFADARKAYYGDAIQFIHDNDLR